MRTPKKELHSCIKCAVCDGTGKEASNPCTECKESGDCSQSAVDARCPDKREWDKKVLAESK
jgi:DnaJ-class molecular chaperone